MIDTEEIEELLEDGFDLDLGARVALFEILLNEILLNSSLRQRPIYRNILKSGA